jgi:hypothetical protein
VKEVRFEVARPSSRVLSRTSIGRRTAQPPNSTAVEATLAEDGDGGCAEIGIVLPDDTMCSSLGRSRSLGSGVGVVDLKAET